MSKRNYTNPFPDYKGGSVGEIQPDFEKKLPEIISKLLIVLEDGIKGLPTGGDYTVYTGFGGQALLYLHLSERLGEEKRADYLNKALHLITPALPQISGRTCTFLCGDGGVLATAAVLYQKYGHTTESKDCIKRLEALHVKLLGDGKKIWDELLYGRVGYLSCLLFIQMHLGKDAIKSSIYDKVCDSLFRSGQDYSASRGFPCPLMYTWHDSEYLGAAHGVTGILAILMQISEDCVKSRLTDLVRPTIEYLLTLQFPSGNFPSSIGSSSGDKLVHWCHGAPGWAYMFVLAYKVFNEEKYLSAARTCTDVVWERGLLKKGDSLCHGSAGNAYTFLCLYQLTKEEKYLYRAVKFAEWCFDFDNHNTLNADRPFSLFEGIAGTIYFLADMLKPGEAKFPTFQMI